MYSYEDRIKAVRLYMKLGKRSGVTIRQLGYPTKNTLIGWYREFIDKQALRAGYTRSRGKFTVAQKQHAVQHYMDHGRCIAFTLRALGYPSRETFSKWLDELHPDERIGPSWEARFTSNSPARTRMNPRSLSWTRPKENREREKFRSKKWAIPDFSAVHGQETFSGMALLQGRGGMHERYRAQFTSNKW